MTAYPRAECTNASGGCFTANACLLRCGKEKTRKEKRIPITYLHHSQKIEGGKIQNHFEAREVYVLAVADGYAMVRRKGCAPYIVLEKELPL